MVVLDSPISPGISPYVIVTLLHHIPKECFLVGNRRRLRPEWCANHPGHKTLPSLWPLNWFFTQSLLTHVMLSFLEEIKMARSFTTNFYSVIEESHTVEAAEKMAQEKDALHFLRAFTADLVTLAEAAVFFSTALMTPMATVCLMSRTAKRPGGQNKKSEISEETQKARLLGLSQRCFSSLDSAAVHPAHLTAGTRRRSPHTWPCRGPSARWLRRLTSGP